MTLFCNFLFFAKMFVSKGSSHVRIFAASRNMVWLCGIVVESPLLIRRIYFLESILPFFFFRLKLTKSEHFKSFDINGSHKCLVLNT